MPDTSADLLDPRALHQLNNLQLVARAAVDGFLSGMHRSLVHGFGTEFLQYRTYTPGEDLKYLDWKVLARTDRLVTKVYQEETNMNVYLLIDASASMDYQSERAAVSKYRYACMAAACIAYLASRQGDNVGLFVYGDDLIEAVPPGHRSDQLKRVLQALERVKPSGGAKHRMMLERLTHHFRHRGVVVFLSDMLEAEETVPELLRQFRIRHCDCVGMQVLDPDELDLPYQTLRRFEDAESGSEVVTWPEAVRERYQESMNAFLSTLQKNLLASQIDYLRLTSNDNLGISLARYLDHRERLS